MHYHHWWKTFHPTYYAIKQAEIRKKNPEKAREFSRKWKKNNPEKRKECDRKRRNKKHQAEGSHTEKETKTLFIRQRGCCAICHKKLSNNYHQDHIIPLVKGGNDYIYNIQILCADCNYRKHARDPIEYMQMRGFLL